MELQGLQAAVNLKAMSDFSCVPVIGALMAQLTARLLECESACCAHQQVMYST